jgi:predicted MPP superfamily phosphohydrolase
MAQTAASPQDLDRARELDLDVKLMFPSPVPDRIILNLTANPETSVAVNWRTDTTIRQGIVEVALATDGTQFTKELRKITAKMEYLRVMHDKEPVVSAHYHSAVMDGLSPGQVYVYRVGSENQWSEWFQFQMPDNKKGRALSFLYFGDAQNDVKSHWSRVIREAYKKMPSVDFMLHAGDLINRHDHDIEWGEWFQAGSFIHASVPSVMTPGNHEYRNVKLSPHWRPQYNLPMNGPGGLEETCYQLNYHDMKVISLDAEQIDESPYFAEKQARWLDSILVNDPRKWTVLTIHYPFYSTKANRDNEELRSRFKPILDKHKVDIVLQGHDHAYGRGMVSNLPSGQNLRAQTSGTMYVVSVSGPKMYDLSEDPWMFRKAGNSQMFQIITIQDNQLLYHAYTAKGELYDSFILEKKEGKPNKLIDKIPNTPEKR